MHDSKEDLAKRLYGTAKVTRPDADFGLHLDHQQTTWDPFQRALLDVSEIATYCDFIKPIAYHDIAGPRIKNWFLGQLHASILGDVPMDTLLSVFYDLAGYDATVEPGIDDLDRKGLTEEYVYRLTKRLVDGVRGQVPIYPGIGFDVPMGDDAFCGDPDRAARAALRALDAGAEGIVLSREYDEMRLPTLQAIGSVLKERFM